MAKLSVFSNGIMIFLLAALVRGGDNDQEKNGDNPQQLVDDLDAILGKGYPIAVSNARSKPIHRSSKPSYPPCKDYKSKDFCESQIAKYGGKQYCKRNALVGRYQCCGTCAQLIKPGAQKDEYGVVTGMQVLIAMAPYPCDDQRTSDGKSWTSWCEKYAMGKEDTVKTSCFKPSVQLVCLRSCGLCSGGGTWGR